MKKINSLLAMVIVTLAMFTTGSCSKDDAIGEDKPTYYATHEDSLRTISLIWSSGIEKSDVQIVSADSSTIRVNNAALAKVHGENPHMGNFLAIWLDMHDEIFYMRATSVKTIGDLTEIKGNKCDPFSAFSDLDIDLSTDLYYNSNFGDQDNVGRALSNAASQSVLEMNPYTEIDENNKVILHPFAIILPEETVDNAEGGLPSAGCIDGRFNGYAPGSIISVEQLVKDKKIPDLGLDGASWNWNKSWVLETGPMRLEIPIAGGNTYNVPGTYSQLISMAKKDLGQEAGKNPASLKILLDQINFKCKSGITISVETSWFRPKKFEMYSTLGYGVYANAIGIACGVSHTGQKDIVAVTPINCFFWLGPVPIKLDVRASIAAKWTVSCMGAGKYECDFKFYRENQLGIGWKKGDGGYTISRSTAKEFNFYKPSSFSDFIDHSGLVMYGRGEVGLYFRVAPHIYGIGPTLGIGAKTGISADLGADIDYKGGKLDVTRSEAYLSGDFSLVAEVGGEARAFGQTLWSRNYDINLWKTELFNLKP